VLRWMELFVIGCCTLACASEKFQTDPNADAGNGGIKRVFMTSLPYGANFGGLAAADSTCTQHAGALGGSWKAWLSTETTPAAARLSAWDGQYRVVSGTPIADSWGDLTDSWLDGAIDHDENGAPAPQLARVWTGTRSDGTWSGKDCSGWTSSLDALVATAGGISTASTWTEGDDLICDQQAHFFCIEQ
jgi:hypothetical protein